ncbi:MAG: dihydropteridine reductase [Clostridia bacterium]|nr:dihydropteridine reductase [Clostridia bacterium]
MQNNNAFEYTYTAPTEEERKKTQSIRERYQQASGNTASDKVARLQALDKKAKLPPMIIGWTLGVLGTLIFGGGLAMALETDKFLWGCILAAFGLIPVALAYPVYRAISKKQKAKYREEILRLSDEILKEE